MNQKTTDDQRIEIIEFWASDAYRAAGRFTREWRMRKFLAERQIEIGARAARKLIKKFADRVVRLRDRDLSVREVSRELEVGEDLVRTVLDQIPQTEQMTMPFMRAIGDAFLARRSTNGRRREGVVE